MATMLLRLDGIEADDAERLEAVLRAMPGVFGVVVSPKQSCAEVDIEDDELDIDRLLDRVRAAGFAAQISG